MRLACQDALERRAELFEDIVDCRDDDGHVVGSECGLGWDRLGLVEPVAEGVHDEAEIPMNPEDNESQKPESGRREERELGAQMRQWYEYRVHVCGGVRGEVQVQVTVPGR